MTPFTTLAIFNFDGQEYRLTLSDNVSIIDRGESDRTILFQPGLLNVRIPSREIDMAQRSNNLSGTGSIEVSSHALDLWTLSQTTIAPQRGLIRVYAHGNEDYLQDCTLLYSGILGPIKYSHNKGTWGASMLPKENDVDIEFPPISVDQKERYGILDWPCLGAIAIDTSRGSYEKPGAVTAVLNNALQNGNEALPVVYGTVYDASVPVLQARLITWAHGDPPHEIYSEIAYDVGVACHPIIGTARYRAPGETVVIHGDAGGVGGAVTDIKGWVDVNQDGYIIPNQYTSGAPADFDANNKNRKSPSPFYYEFDKKGQLTVVANVRCPPKDTPIPTPTWVDPGLVEGLPTPHGHFAPFSILMPDIDTATWNIPVLTGKPSGNGARAIDGLGDVLLDLWRSFARQSLKEIDLPRVNAAIPTLNKYTVGMLFNSKPTSVTLTRVLASRVAPQFPISFGAPAGIWGFDGLEFPQSSDPVVRHLMFPVELDERVSVVETDKKNVRNRFLIKYKYSGWRGETTEESNLDKGNHKGCHISEMVWGRSPIHEIDAPDISDSQTASLVALEWARRLTKVRTRYQYRTYDHSVVSIPLASHILLTDEEIGIKEKSVCYEGCTINTGNGLITMRFLSIDGS